MYTWANAGHSIVLRDADGANIPATEDNRHYREILDWISAGNEVAPFVPPARTVGDVKAEAQRRIIALTGANDFNACIVKQLNASMRATELVNKRALGEALSPSEEAEAAALQGLADTIKAVRSKSNVIEGLNPIPPDFTDDSYWV